MTNNNKEPNTCLQLHKTQLWFQSIINSQLGLIHNKDSIDEQIAEDDGIEAIKRMNIYHQGYFNRLLQCLRAEFPLLCHAFSQKWFDEMALRYLAQHPSRSRNLNDLGKAFPEFLNADRPDFQSSEKIPAFDFIVSLARFERCQSEVYRGHGIENTDFALFDDIENSDFNSIELKLAPSLRLLHSTFDLCAYAKQQQPIDHQAPKPQPQHIMISRINYRVLCNPIKPWQFEFLKHLQNDCSVKRAIKAIKYKDDNIPGYLPIWISYCVELGAFSDYNTIN
jgi:hypothetical protein